MWSLWRRLVLFVLVSRLHDRSLGRAGAARLARAAGRAMPIEDRDRVVRRFGSDCSTVAKCAPEDITVRGGVIVAWGSTDIDDRASELPRRHEIGVHSYGSYHSIDPGKLTMAPHFAAICADRILSKSAP